MLSQKRVFEYWVCSICCVQCKQSLRLCKHVRGVHTFHMMFIAFDFLLSCVSTFVEPTSQKKETICLARCDVCWSSCQRWQWRMVEVKVVAVIANIDAINTEPRSGTNTMEQHSNTANRENVMIVIIFAIQMWNPFGFLLQFVLLLSARHVTCRKENRCIKKSNSLPWKRQKMKT